ncbi:MAG TPA: C4-type zinc ribbon domain-containing protein [Acidimicrobiales bacterium]
MASLDQLLVLQEHDTSLEQLEHRRATLPDRDRLVALVSELASVDARHLEVGAARDEVARTQKRLEDEVASVEAKVADVHTKLYAGGVTSPRELQALQDDENALKRHQTTLEDKVLEQMELAVPLDVELADLVERRGAIADQVTTTEGQISVAEAEIDVRLDEVRGEREALATGLDAALVEQYEQLRHDLGGIAVARLVGTNCGGCHLTLSAVELDRVRHQPEGTLVFCGECGRLLVR